MTGIQFQDANFRLACLDVLFDLGYFASELERLLDISVPPDEFQPNALRVSALEEIAITQDHLDRIERLGPDGGDDIYFHVFPNWGGTESELYIRSFGDLSLLRNLKDLWVHAVSAPSSLDLLHLLPLVHLDDVDTDWFYINRDSNPHDAINALQSRGIAVTISGTLEQ